MRTLLIISLRALLYGCSINIKIISVSMDTITESDLSNIRSLSSYPLDRIYERISVTVPREDILSALRAESSVFIDVSDCGNPGNDFPAVAFYLDVALDEGHRDGIARIEQARGDVQLNGYIPTSFSQNLASICLQLVGGGYTGYKITSAITPVPR